MEPFILKLNANRVLLGITLPGSNTPAKYSAYVGDVTAFMKSNAEIDELSKEISMYEEVTGATINCEKSVGLLLSAWKGISLLGPFIYTDGPLMILDVCFGPDLQLEKDLDVREKAEAAVRPWSRRRISLNMKAEVCA